MFYLLALGFGAGVVSGSIMTWGLASGLFVLLLGLAVIVVAWLCGNDKWLRLVGLLLLVFVIGLVRVDVSSWRDQALDPKLGQIVELTGQVVTPSKRVGSGERFSISPETSRDRVLVTVATSTILYPGDVAVVRGELKEPENFDDSFDYCAYLAKDRVYYLLDKAELLQVERRVTVLGSLNKLRRWFIGNLQAYLPDPDAPLVAGIVLGDETGLSAKLDDLFRVVGLSHIIVLSGYNLTVVGEGVRRLLSFLPLRIALYSSGGVLLLFALAAGGGASVARATIMALLVLWAKSGGRVYDVTRALLLAALIMLWWNPKLLVFDAGFQLSFLATAGILYLSEPLEARLKWLQRWPAACSLVATTISAQVAVLPWLVYLFGNVSLVALPTNLLVLPVVPLLMFLGLLLGLLGFVPFVWLPLALFVHLIVVYVVALSNIAAEWRFASVTVGYWSLSLVALSYYLIYLWYRRMVRLAVGERA